MSAAFNNSSGPSREKRSEPGRVNRVISAVCKHGITPALFTRPASRLREGIFLKPGSPAANT